MNEFVHLHLHSEYSLLDGACRISDIPKAAKENGHSAVAITDHGVMYGVVDFYKACKEENIKPIIGCEVYVAENSRFERVKTQSFFNSHLVLLVKNEIGYKNLIYMVSKSFTDGFYVKPRIDLELLKNHSEGLICLSGCLSGHISRAILQGNIAEAERHAKEMLSIFGSENYYIEIQSNGASEEAAVTTEAVNLAKRLGISIVATNDVHYIRKADAETQAVLMCIQTNSKLNAPGAMSFEGSDYYYRSTEEMVELFKDYPEAISNTVKIADACNFDFVFGKNQLPVYTVPDGTTPKKYLEKLAREGLEKKIANKEITFNDKITIDDYKSRIIYELLVIAKMGYEQYYLIVWDFVNYAKTHGISVGPGRGSGAGSLIAYLIGITEVDSIKYNLLFERFLNPERVSMPDFDIDFGDDKRDCVIEYVTEKYGSDRVSQIVTFGTLAAKQAIRDVGRALDMPYNEVDKIVKMLDHSKATKLDELMTDELRTLCKETPEVANLIEKARALEGMPRNVSTHAAGVIITEKELTSYIPLATSGDVVITQFNMNNIASLGLLKFDFLALRNLTIIDRAEKEIQKREPSFNIKTIPSDDTQTLDIISKGQTAGVFQLESAGLKRLLSRMKPRSIEDITLAISLYRPGPMDSIPKYLEYRENPQKIAYKIPLLKDILDETSGIIIYQEQVMQICRRVANFSYGKADIIRRAMAKKKSGEIEKERSDFLKGAKANFISEEVANDLFDEMAGFAKYAFNKSHAASYSFISYRTAYLKAHYPLEYYASLLTSVMGNNAKTAEYITDCAKQRIKVLPPDINESMTEFSAKQGYIRFGLVGIKHLGYSFVDNIILERSKAPFTSFENFDERMIPYGVTKQQLAALASVGAFDSFKIERNRLLMSIEEIHSRLSDIARRDMTGQTDLFSTLSENEAPAKFYYEYPECEPLSSKQKLILEKENIGIYLSGNLLDDYSKDISTKRYTPIATILSAFDEASESYGSMKDKSNISVIGIVTKVTRKNTKNGDLMAFVTLEDYFGEIEIIVFSKNYLQSAPVLVVDNAVYISGTISTKEDDKIKILAFSVSPLSSNVTATESKKENITKETLPPKKELPYTESRSAHFQKNENISETVPAKQVFIRLKSFDSYEYRRVMGIIGIFFEEANAEIILYNSQDKKYTKITNTQLKTSKIVIDTLRKICGDENVILR